METIKEELFQKAFDNREDLSQYAVVFSEGDNLLRDTLLSLWNNNICTYSCCMGHDYTEYYVPAYIAIIIDEHSISLINNICNKLLPEEKDLCVKIGNINANNYDSFNIYMRGNTKEKSLNFINQYVTINNDVNNKFVSESLSLFEFAKDLSLNFEIEIRNGVVYMEFRNKTDNITYIEYKAIDESIESLNNIDSTSNLSIMCGIDELSRIIDIFNQRKTHIQM